MKVQCITPFIVVVSNHCDFCKENKPLEYLVTAVNGATYSICSSCRMNTLNTLGVPQYVAEPTIWIDKDGAVV